MIPARIIHLDAKGSTHAPPHRAVSFSDWYAHRMPVGVEAWRLDRAVTLMLSGKGPPYVDVWLVNGQRVRVRPSAKWLEARKGMFK